MSFEVTSEQLSALHKEQGLDKLRDFGGTKGLLSKLKVDVEKGVSISECQLRTDTFGENRIPEKPPKSYIAYLLDTFADVTIRLLSACALISIVIGVAFHREEAGYMEGLAILVTVLLVCNIQAFQDWSKERSFRKLNADVQRSMISVLRDGKQIDVLKYELVVGDIVRIGVGDILEADGVLLNGTEVECDESALTGEPEGLKKNLTTLPFLFAATSVINGTGVYLVTAVGIHSMSGKITALIRGQKVNEAIDPETQTAKSIGTFDTDVDVENQADTKEKKEEEDEEGDETENSVLRQKLDSMVAKIGYFAFGSAGIATVAMLLRYVIIFYGIGDHKWSWSEDPSEILEAIVTGIAIVVVAVPEGLPLAVTLALSLSMAKMQLDHNLVKHLDATETMGSATTICSDKTGTLTQNRMTVVKAFVGGQQFIGDATKDSTCGKKMEKSGLMSKAMKSAITENISFTKSDGADIEWDPAADRWTQKGNKTDCALLALVNDLDVNYQELCSRTMYKVIQPDGAKTFGLKMYPFSSARKRAGQAVPVTDDPKGPCRIYLKGATEVILKLSSTQMQIDGTLVPLSEASRHYILKEVDKFAAASMRTIGLAYRDFDSPPDWDELLSTEESVKLTGQEAKTYKAETDVVFLGLMGISDPIRDGVPRAVQRCNTAGVDVRMVTGDHLQTAIAIAKECGILRDGVDYKGDKLSNEFTAMVGEEFRNRVLNQNGQLVQSKFDEVWPRLRVLARSSPEDKHTLVTGLCDSQLFTQEEKVREFGIYPDKQIVAVTGDGTNDAPALRKAHVGFAMFITGTRVAQDAADILLLDDNFESVVKACMWGRNVYDSIAKFLQFQLTVNISAVSISLVGAVAVSGMPLSVVQMLWVNLIMDSLGALALASEPPTLELLNRKPYGRHKSLISYEMWCNMIGQATLHMSILLAMLFGAGESCPADQANCKQCASPTSTDCFNWEKGGWLNLESGINRDHGDDPSVHYTLIFNSFVFMQLFNWINCRKLFHEVHILKGVEKNTNFIIIWTLCAVVQVLICEVLALDGSDGINPFFQSRHLNSWQWGMSLGCGILVVFWQFVIVFVGRSLKPHFVKDDSGPSLPAIPIVTDVVNAEEQLRPADEVSNASTSSKNSFNQKKRLVADAELLNQFSSSSTAAERAKAAEHMKSN